MTWEDAVNPPVTEPQDFVRRPALAFRVGITGTRQIDPAALPSVRAALAAVLAKVKAEVEAGGAADVGTVYAAAPPQLRLLSPLAEGADRVAAKEALAQGYCLEAPLPFAPNEYEKDFPGSRAQFRALLGQARAVFVLDGARGELEGASYEAAGRHVARNCDLLIAVWDGTKSKGRGGTAEIVQYAVRQGQAVWWLRPDGADSPGWIGSREALRRLTLCPRGGAAWAELQAHLRAAVRLPPAPEGLATLLAEPPPSGNPVWHLQQWIIARAARRTHRLLPSVTVPTGPVPAYWGGFFSPVDRLAIGYANRYRSAYTMIAILAVLALACATFAFGAGWEAVIAALLEMVCIGGIFLLAGANARRRWHERALAYRLLAELLRKQQALAVFGWSLPVTTGALPGMAAGGGKSGLWAAWYFKTVCRAAPLPEGELRGSGFKAALHDVRTSLIVGQAHYHAKRRDESETAAARLGRWSRWFFLATFILIFLKFLLLLLGHGVALPPIVLAPLSVVLRLLLALLPGFSAAFACIRGYSELELVAEQSAVMLEQLAETEAALQSLDPDAPLASEAAGRELSALAESMLRDIRGWASLVRVKTIEPA